MFGHQTTLHSLATLLTEGRLPHALLFHGPRGIGKATLATKLAWRLICGAGQPEEAPEADMFGNTPAAPPSFPLSHNTQSPQAAQLEAGTCPDFHILKPEEGKKSTSVKQVATLLETLQRTADTARTSLIDTIEDLTPEAANMLLKTLEEPRPGIYFLLVSHQLSRVLPTIRSRCRLVRMGPLTQGETRMVLTAHNEDPNLAPIAAGCPGLILGEAGQKRRKLAEQLANWQRGEGPAPAPTAEGLLPEVLHQLATKPRPTLADANLYSQLFKLARQQAELNLSTAWVNTTALAKLTPNTRNP